VFRSKLFFSAALLGLLAGATQARATVLPVGTTVIPDAVSNPIGAPGNTTLATMSGSFNAANIDFGTYSSTVVRESSGTLDFVYQFANSPNSLTALERMSMFNYTGLNVDVSYVAGSGDRQPVSVDRTTGGAVVAFNFPSAGALQTGASSDLLIVRTNATTFDTGTVTFQDGAATTVAGFEPLSVPEPSTLALSGIGGLCLLGTAWRRRRIAAA
jgi:hypothetical protein